MKVSDLIYVIIFHHLNVNIANMHICSNVGVSFRLLSPNAKALQDFGSPRRQ